MQGDICHRKDYRPAKVLREKESCHADRVQAHKGFQINKCWKRGFNVSALHPVQCVCKYGIDWVVKGNFNTPLCPTVTSPLSIFSTKTIMVWDGAQSFITFVPFQPLQFDSFLLGLVNFASTIAPLTSISSFPVNIFFRAVKRVNYSLKIN